MHLLHRSDAPLGPCGVSLRLERAPLSRRDAALRPSDASLRCVRCVARGWAVHLSVAGADVPDSGGPSWSDGTALSGRAVLPFLQPRPCQLGAAPPEATPTR